MRIEIGNSESTRSSLGRRFWSIFGVLLPCWVLLVAFSDWTLAQQPPGDALPPYQVNAKYVQGRTWADYQATAGAGLTLNVAAGISWCQGAMVTYAGGTLTMTNAATNYVYLDPASSCAPAKNTTGFSAAVIPLATVVTSGGAITTVSDRRALLWSVATSGGGGGFILYADTYTGADFSAKVNAAIAACPATGCYIDARGLTGSQTMSADIGPFGSSTQSITIELGARLDLHRASGKKFLIGEWSTLKGQGWRTVIWGTVGDTTPAIVPAPGAYRSMRISDLAILNAGTDAGIDLTYNAQGSTGVFIDRVQIAAVTGIKFWGYYNRITNGSFLGDMTSGTLWAGILMDYPQSVNSNVIRDNNYSGASGTGVFVRGGYANKFEGKENTESIGLGYYVDAAATEIHGPYVEGAGCGTAWASTTEYGLGAVITDGTHCQIAVTAAATSTLASVSNAAGGNTVYHGTIVGCPANYTTTEYAAIAGFSTPANNGAWPIVACTAGGGGTITLANAYGVAETKAATATNLSNHPGTSKSGGAPSWSVTNGGTTTDGTVTWMMYTPSAWVLLSPDTQDAVVDGPIANGVVDLNYLVNGRFGNQIQTTGNLAWGYVGQAPYSLTAKMFPGFVFGEASNDLNDSYVSFNYKNYNIGGGGTYAWGPQIDAVGTLCTNGGYCGHMPLHVGLGHFSAGIQDFGPVTVSALPTPAAPTVAVVGTPGSTTLTYYVVAHCGGGVTLPSAGTTITNAPDTLSSTNKVTITVPTTYNFTDPLIAGTNADDWSMCTWDFLKGDTGHSLNAPGAPQRPPNRIYTDDGSVTSLFTYTAPTRNTTGDHALLGGVHDVKEIATPENPAADTERWYADSSTHKMTCITSSGASCAPAVSLPPASQVRSCQISLGDGLNAIPAGTYPIDFQCKNDTGATITVSEIKCATDNAGTSTCMAATNAPSNLLSAVITGTTGTWVTGTQSATTTVTNGQWLKATFVSDGMSKLISLDVKGTL